MNWGKGIAIVIVAFMLYIVSFVYRAFQKDADLVREDYYEYEVNYDQNKEDKQNYNKMEGELEVKKLDQGISFQFPDNMSEKIDGSIKFYRPDKKSFDREFQIELDQNNQQILEYDHFVEGRYDITVQWKDPSKGYIFEDQIIF